MRPPLALKSVLDGKILARGTQTPVILRKHAINNLMHGDIPALTKWFENSGQQGKKLRESYWKFHGDTTVQMELTQSAEPRFSRFEAPMELFLKWQSSRLTQNDSSSPFGTAKNDIMLYIAQTSLSSLPQRLQDDLPIPQLITDSDVYGSSLWLGVPPTRTPLHKDPNDNLFIQLCGTKLFRLLRPQDGTAIIGHTRVRLDEEMMISDNANDIEEWLWKDSLGNSEQDMNGMICYEAQVEENDGIFIPRGWWHSVRGVGEGINASVNWWFR